MTDSKDFSNFLLQAEVENLRKRIEQLENGEVYTSLIHEIATLRAENDSLRINSVKLEDVRRILD